MVSPLSIAWHVIEDTVHMIYACWSMAMWSAGFRAGVGMSISLMVDGGTLRDKVYSCCYPSSCSRVSTA